MNGVWHAAKLRFFATLAARWHFAQRTCSRWSTPSGRSRARSPVCGGSFSGCSGLSIIVVMLAALWTLTRPNRGLTQEPLEGTHQLSPKKPNDEPAA